MLPWENMRLFTSDQRVHLAGRLFFSQEMVKEQRCYVTL